MKKNKRYMQFITDALLKEDANPRKLRRHLKALQKEDPVTAPLPREEALEDWYSRNHLPHAPAAPSKFRVRIWVASASAVMAAILIFFIISPNTEKSEWVTEDNAAYNQTEGLIEEEAATEAESEAYDAEYSSGSAAAETAPEEPAPDTPQSTEDEVVTGSTEASSEAVSNDELDRKENLWSLIAEQYAANEALSFTAIAADTPNEEGFIELTAGIRLVLSEDAALGDYTGCVLQIHCEAGQYTLDESTLTVCIEDADALSITVIE